MNTNPKQLISNVTQINGIIKIWSICTEILLPFHCNGGNYDGRNGANYDGRNGANYDGRNGTNYDGRNSQLGEKKATSLRLMLNFSHGLVVVNGEYKK